MIFVYVELENSVMVVEETTHCLLLCPSLLVTLSIIAVSCACLSDMVKEDTRRT